MTHTTLRQGNLSLDSMLNVNAAVPHGQSLQEFLERTPTAGLHLALLAVTPGAALLAEEDDETPTTQHPGLDTTWTDEMERSAQRAVARVTAAFTPPTAFTAQAQLAAEAETRERLANLLDTLKPADLLLLALARQTGRHDLLGLQES